MILVADLFKKKQQNSIFHELIPKYPSTSVCDTHIEGDFFTFYKFFKPDRRKGLEGGIYFGSNDEGVSSATRVLQPKS
jgi:hypothetical protein